MLRITGLTGERGWKWGRFCQPPSAVHVGIVTVTSVPGIDAHLWRELKSFLNLPGFQIVLLMPQMLRVLKHFNFEVITLLLF